MKQFVEDMLNVLCHALASTGQHFDEGELLLAASERLKRCMDGVKGNRVKQSGMTRDDCKLILVAVARECIAVVERSDGS